MPGGSYSDILFWNGNGVRDAAGRVDPERVKDGYPTIDYSGYAPSFLLDTHTSAPSATWNGNVDVKTEHDFIRSLPGCQPLVTVNAGTGRAEDAAQWVHWANKVHKYNVRYWEVGNELEGTWEAGHFLKGGGELTPAMYAHRYLAFAKAMKAQDPSVLVGGAASGSDAGGFTREMLKEDGAWVDFVSFHTYPGQPEQPESELLANIPKLDPAVSRIRGWIRKYQPERASHIPICITEWNLALSDSTDGLFSALFSSEFLAEMAESGVDFANQWDAFTQTPGTGGGLALIVPGAHPFRKSQYWALWLWRRYAGRELLETSLDHPQQNLYTCATRTANSVRLMLVNTGHDAPIRVRVSLSGFNAGAAGEQAILSHRQYFWDRLSQRANWDAGPLVLPAATGDSFTEIVPEYSVVWVRIPRAGHRAVTPEAAANRLTLGRTGGPGPVLRIEIKPSAFADTPATGWVRAYIAGTNKPWPHPLPPASLTVTGPARLDRSLARLDESAGRFVLLPSGSGRVAITAESGALTVTGVVTLKPSIPQPRILWTWKPGVSGASFTSDWKLTGDADARANVTVARVDLQNVQPTEKVRNLLTFTNIPPAIRKRNVRGVVFDLKVSPSFSCTDPTAGLWVVMQSQANYWMPLGGVPLPGTPGHWKSYRFTVTDPKQIAAMPDLFNVMLILRAGAPVSGTVWVDRVGLLVR
ncbi:MAG: hypothetical protein KGJ62_03395 [Armatimonadetes bacterium]|nr:hypothetical protein [Armatimonadota bacterium]MDE2205721.1 hypothetical protein [Armatimonadota bacterium]